MPSKKDAATTAPAADTASLIESLLARLYRADQLDFLHLSLINLLEMTADDEIEMILDALAHQVEEVFEDVRRQIPRRAHVEAEPLGFENVRTPAEVRVFLENRDVITFFCE